MCALMLCCVVVLLCCCVGCADQNLNVDRYSDMVEYGLAGMVKLRLEKHLLNAKHWPPKIKPRPESLKSDLRGMGCAAVCCCVLLCAAVCCILGLPFRLRLTLALL